MTEIAEPPRLVPEAPPPDAWTEAADRLTAHAHAAEALVRTAHADWAAAARREVLAPLAEAAAQAAAAHERHAARLRVRLPEAPHAAAAAYRAAVCVDVVEPLRAVLARAGAAVLGDLYGTFLATLAVHPDDLPESATLPAPAALFEPDVRDGTTLRARKAARRARRAGRASALGAGNALRRLVRRAPRPLPPAGRTVPARHLAAFHALVRLPDALIALHPAVQDAYAARVAALEQAVLAWTHAVLGLEATHDAPACHLPADVLPADVPASPDLAPLTDHAERLQAALADAAEPVPLPALDDEALAAATRAALDDVDRGGSFFVPLRARRLPADGRGAADRAAARAAAYAARHARAAGSFELSHRLLDLRATLVRLEDQAIARPADAGLRPLLSAFARLGADLRADLDAATPDLDAGPTAEGLRRLRDAALARFEPVLRNLPGLVGAQETLRAAGTAEGEAAAAYAAALPERIAFHAPVDPLADAAPQPEAPRRDVPFRSFVEAALGPPLPGRLAAPADALRRAIVDAWGAVEDVEHIIRYNLDAALDELGGSPEGDGGADGARELARDGVTRAAARLDALAEDLAPSWHAYAAAVHRAFSDDWADLHRRVRSDAAVERTWTGVEMRLRRGGGRMRRASALAYRANAERARRLFRLGRRRAATLVRRGQEAVGVREGAVEGRRAVLDALAGVDALRAGLPLVYRRLFTFEPLEEPALLEGRAADLGRARAHAERWRSGVGAGPLVVTLGLGAGRTTFLNALAAALPPAFSVHHLALAEREDEAAFAARLADALDLPPAADLAALEAAVEAAARGEAAPVLLVDDLEHLLLRAPGGRALIERALLCFARIAEHVLVVAVTGAATWRFVDRTAPGVAALATTHAAAAIDRAALEALVLGRHRRSGMPLRFETPPEPSPLLRQRLRRARTEEARQAVLRTDFFDRLHRAAGQNVMLALLYWLRAADVAAEPGAVVVHPLVPLPLAFLGALDLPSAFALKAFVLHHTLTVEEHNRVFRAGDAQTLPLLSSLLALRLIEPADPALRARPDAATRLRPDARYRLNPLLLHPITEHLRARHILY